MAAPFVLALAAVCLAAAVFLTFFGLLQIGSGRGRRKTAAPLPAAALAATVAPQPAPHWVHLDEHPALQAEPGVLLNTLWEHLTTAECQQGECGGCRLRLLDGQVRWIRDPQIEIDRSTHILACSCEPLGTVRCERP